MERAAPAWNPAVEGFQEHIFDVYRALRDHDPVHVAADGSFVLSRFDDVWQAVNDWSTFSSADVAEAHQLNPSMIYMDPPRHKALRDLVARAFTPRRISDLEPRIREIVRDQLDVLATGPGGDLVELFAAPVPSIVMGELLGVPPEYTEQFRHWTEAFIDVASPAEIADRAVKIHELFGVLLAERRRLPADDLMSALLAAEINGERLSDDDLVGFCFLLLIAGNDTTTSLIGNGAELLQGHPDQRAALAADPSLIPDALEEMVRIESPTQALPRTATRDVELHGVTIPAGSRVMLLWGAANHDERVFPDPERFDIRRRPTRHLGFGHGIHFCIGAALARLEGRVAFEELLDRMPHYTFQSDRSRHTSNWARAWRQLNLQPEVVA